jgi:cell division protein FtsL
VLSRKKTQIIQQKTQISIKVINFSEALLNEERKEETNSTQPKDNRLNLDDEETLRKIQCYFYWKIFFIVLTMSLYIVFNYLTGMAGNTPIINLRE